jgi:hypothetical protein
MGKSASGHASRRPLSLPPAPDRLEVAPSSRPSQASPTHDMLTTGPHAGAQRVTPGSPSPAAALHRGRRCLTASIQPSVATGVARPTTRRSAQHAGAPSQRASSAIALHRGLRRLTARCSSRPPPPPPGPRPPRASPAYDQPAHGSPTRHASRRPPARAAPPDSPDGALNRHRHRPVLDRSSTRHASRRRPPTLAAPPDRPDAALGPRPAALNALPPRPVGSSPQRSEHCRHNWSEIRSGGRQTRQVATRNASRR